MKVLYHTALLTRLGVPSSFLHLESPTPFGQLAIVKRVMKGIYNIRPSTVSDKLQKRKTAMELSLKELSVKVSFLLCLLSDQRCQTIVVLDIREMDLLEDRYIFHVKEKLKQSWAGYHITPIEFMDSTDEKLCVFTHLQEYMKKN